MHGDEPSKMRSIAAALRLVETYKMSTTIPIGIPPQSANQSYSVETIENCQILRGSIPINVVVAITKDLPRGALVHTRLAKQFGATLVAGMPDDLARLAKVAPPMPLPPGAHRLPTPAIEWLQYGERGASSEAMFDALFDGHFASNKEESTAAPSDADDFSRCRKLAEALPDCKDRFDRVAALSPTWAGIVAAWDSLCATMDAEAPEWRSGKGTGKQTYAALRALRGEV